jgi:hypothetical protein
MTLLLWHQICSLIMVVTKNHKYLTVTMAEFLAKLEENHEFLATLARQLLIYFYVAKQNLKIFGD